MLAYEVRALTTVNRLINAKGVTVSWKQFVDGAPPDPDKEWKVGPSVSTTFTPKIFFLTSDQKTKEFLQYMVGAEIPTGYERALMAGNVPFTPALKDGIVFAGRTLGLEWLDPVRPAGNVLLWKMGFAP